MPHLGLAGDGRFVLLGGGNGVAVVGIGRTAEIAGSWQAAAQIDVKMKIWARQSGHRREMTIKSFVN